VKTSNALDSIKPWGAASAKPGWPTPCNSGLDDFVRSYSLYISSLYILRAEFDNLEVAVPIISKEFLDKVSKIDPLAVDENTFWRKLALLEDMPSIERPLEEYFGRLVIQEGDADGVYWEAGK